jgi:hypothetical protein
MSITSADICQAADCLQGFVVRFSEDSFGMDVADTSITPASEFVWQTVDNELMTLKRELIQLLLDQNINDRLAVTEPLLAYAQAGFTRDPGATCQAMM